MSDLEELEQDAKQESIDELRGDPCSECQELAKRLVLCKTDKGWTYVCEKCNLKFCNCGSYLQESDEMTAGECRRCMGDAI